MSTRARSVVVENGEASASPARALQDEGHRLLSGSGEDDQPLPCGPSRNSSCTLIVCDALTFAAAVPPSPHPTSENDVSMHGDFCSPSPTETVASPPFMPTGRHHNFFMVVEESPTTTNDGRMPVRFELSSPPSPASIVNTVVAHARDAPSVAIDGIHSSQMEAVVASSTLHTRHEDSESATRSIHQGDSDKKNEMGRPRRRPRRSAIATAPPFDPARAQQWNLLTMGPDPGLPLYKFEEVPHWQKYNPNIRSSYRAFYTASMCIKSLLGWHNETINVYSHLLTFVAFLVLTVVLYTTVLNEVVSASSLGGSRVIYGVFCFGSLLCMLNSAIYHLFNSHCHQRVMTAMGRLDFIGITVLIETSFLPPLYVMFHCYPVARGVYIAAIMLLGTAGIVGSWTDAFHQHTAIRVGVFLGMGFSGLVPAVHSLVLVPMNATVLSTMLGIWLMVLLYCGGVVFYVTQFPECKYRGHFDCWLSSHQLWHFFVSMAALVHYFNCVGMYQLWQVSDGICE